MFGICGSIDGSWRRVEARDRSEVAGTNQVDGEGDSIDGVPLRRWQEIWMNYLLDSSPLCLIESSCWAAA